MQNYQHELTARTRLPLSVSQPKIRTKAGDNWLLAGRKGSGKTFLFKHLFNKLAALYPTSRLYIADIKFRDFNDWPGLIVSDKAPASPGSNDRIQVWQLVEETPEEIEKWLWQIRHDAPAIVGIDELLMLCYGTRDTSSEFKKIQKLGRDLPVGSLVGTQELVDIPRNAFGQADHSIRLLLKHPYERSLMDRWLGEHVNEPTDEHGFWYNHAESLAPPLYFRDAQEFLGLPRSRPETYREIHSFIQSHSKD